MTPARERTVPEVLVFANRCVSIVYAKRGGDVLDISGSAEPRQKDADAKALALCGRQNPRASCDIAERFCSDWRHPSRPAPLTRLGRKASEKRRFSKTSMKCMRQALTPF